MFILLAGCERIRRFLHDNPPAKNPNQFGALRVQPVRVVPP